MNRHHGRRRRVRSHRHGPGPEGKAGSVGVLKGPSAGRLALAGTAAAGAALALVNWGAGKAAERRHPPTGRLVEVDGVRLHAIRRGRGRPVLYLHGNGTTAADLDVSGLAAALGDQFAVTAIDRPGYGHSERPRDRLWTASAQADLVARALPVLGVERPIVVGHSWGTLVALALALEHPDQVAGLVLVSGYYYPTVRGDVLLFSPQAIPGLGDVVRYTVAPPVSALLLPRLLAKAFAPRPVPERFLRDFPLSLGLRPWQIRASAEDTALMIPSAAALSDGYAALRLPTAILAGEGDRVVTPAHHAERLAAELGTEPRLLPGLGHMLHYDAADQVAAAVRDVAARAAG